MAEVNPITQVHRAIWTCLEARADLMVLVKAGNRIKLTDRTRPPARKFQLWRGDLPELRVERAGSLPQDGRATGKDYFGMRYRILFATGNRVDDDLADVEWAVNRAMAAWRTHIKDPLTWKSINFVSSVTWTGGSVTIEDAKANRGNRGWSAIWLVNVDMWFTPSDILDPT